MRAWDGYIASGTVGAGGLEAGMGTEMAGKWEREIEGLVARGLRRGDGEREEEGDWGEGEGKGDADGKETELRIELWPLLQAHIAKYHGGGQGNLDGECV